MQPTFISGVFCSLSPESNLYIRVTVFCFHSKIPKKTLNWIPFQWKTYSFFFVSTRLVKFNTWTRNTGRRRSIHFNSISSICKYWLSLSSEMKFLEDKKLPFFCEIWRTVELCDLIEKHTKVNGHGTCLRIKQTLDFMFNRKISSLQFVLFCFSLRSPFFYLSTFGGWKIIWRLKMR